MAANAAPKHPPDDSARIEVGSANPADTFPAMPDIRPLLRYAYKCARCPKESGFCISPNGGYFKFPPLIGTTDKADLLFVGINPRRSDTNVALHDDLMQSKQVFMDLALNRTKDAAYIHTTGGEPHYNDHLEVIRQIYGEPRPFESCAAVTELFLCATETSVNLPKPESECADIFLPKVLELIRPKAIVAVGSRVMDYFRTKPSRHRTTDSLRATLFGSHYAVVQMPHPANSKLSELQRARQIGACARKLREIIEC